MRFVMAVNNIHDTRRMIALSAIGGGVAAIATAWALIVGVAITGGLSLVYLLIGWCVYYVLLMMLSLKGIMTQGVTRRAVWWIGVFGLVQSVLLLFTNGFIIVERLRLIVIQ